MTGPEFETEAMAVSDIREEQVYGGKRLRTIADLAGARIPITIDIGFGDAVTAPGYEIDYGSLLDFDSARIRAYSPATVMAEKLQAVIALGLINGRMKDFYDLWAIPRAIDVPVGELGEAVRRRKLAFEFNFDRQGSDGQDAHSNDTAPTCTTDRQ
jgi:hypothetical protein